MPVEFKSAKDTDKHIELTPLIDVVFQLLVFFMLSSQFLDPSIQVTLPTLETAAMPEAAPVVIQADSQGNLFLQDAPVSLENLEGALRQQLQESGEEAVFLRGDATLPYQKILTIMETAGRAGASDFNFIYAEAAQE